MDQAELQNDHATITSKIQLKFIVFGSFIYISYIIYHLSLQENLLSQY